MTDRKHPSGGQSTAAARQRAQRARWRERGWEQVPVVVPAERKDDIREIARQMREDNSQDQSGIKSGD